MKKEIPILFSTAMVQALLAGRKTITRRVINPQPIIDEDSGRVYDGNHKTSYLLHDIYEDWQRGFVQDHSRFGDHEDLMWVREAFLSGNKMDENDTFQVDEKGNYIPHVWYRATDEVRWFDGTSDFPSETIPWKPSIHMPKEAARIWLEREYEVTIERIADITEEQALAEGIQFYDDDVVGRRYKDYLADASGYGNPSVDFPTVGTARESFRSLWQSLHGQPSPVQARVDGKLRTVSYVVYPFDEEAAVGMKGWTHYRGLPLTVVVNPWVYAIPFKVLSTTGRPDITGEIPSGNDKRLGEQHEA